MRIAAEWSEIPVMRRHAYFFVTMVLCMFGASLLRHNPNSVDETIVRARVAANKMVRLAALEDGSAQPESQPVFDKNLSLARPQ